MLRKANLGLHATVMKSRKGLPKALKEAEIEKAEMVICQKKNIHSCTAMERQEGCVAVEQQMHCLGGKTSKEGNEKRKQLAVDYNKHKGMDLSDQQLSFGAPEHKTVKC
jgi:hypothetical protein